MFRVTTIAACLFITCGLVAQKKYQIKGTFIETVVPVKLFLTYGNFTDSSELKNGKFGFKGTINNSVKATLYTQEINSKEKYPKREYLGFYLDEGVTTVLGFKSIKTALVKGGIAQMEYRELQDSLQWIYDMYDNLSDLIKSHEADDTTKTRLRSIYKVLYPKLQAIQTRFIKNHPASLVSWDIVASKGVIIEPDEMEPLFSLLAKELQESEKGKALKERIAKAKLFKIGNPSIDFVSVSPDGKEVSLSSFKGKYVLIDFWASWCGPCRAENPNMVKTYNSLKDKNFEIFGVSLDENRERWLKAVQEDKLPWTQVSDLKGFETVAKTYDIRAIPQNYLLDPEGRIIAKNIRGENMEAVVKKFMGLE
jgi:thiol-disulfide isomerase/thioredoxin